MPVIRGGFGILYDRPFDTIFSNIRQNTPFFAQASRVASSIPE